MLKSAGSSIVTVAPVLFVTVIPVSLPRLMAADVFSGTVIEVLPSSVRRYISDPLVCSTRSSIFDSSAFAASFSSVLSVCVMYMPSWNRCPDDEYCAAVPHAAIISVAAIRIVALFFIFVLLLCFHISALS